MSSRARRPCGEAGQRGQRLLRSLTMAVVATAFCKGDASLDANSQAPQRSALAAHRLTLTDAALQQQTLSPPSHSPPSRMCRARWRPAPPTSPCGCLAAGWSTGRRGSRLRRPKVGAGGERVTWQGGGRRCCADHAQARMARSMHFDSRLTSKGRVGPAGRGGAQGANDASNDASTVGAGYRGTAPCRHSAAAGGSPGADLALVNHLAHQGPGPPIVAAGGGRLLRHGRGLRRRSVHTAGVVAARLSRSPRVWARWLQGLVGGSSAQVHARCSVLLGCCELGARALGEVAKPK